MGDLDDPDPTPLAANGGGGAARRQAPIPTSSWQWHDPLFSDEQYMLLLATALSLLPLREWSLTRRLQHWLLGTGGAAAAAALEELPAHAKPYFIGACHLLLDRQGEHPASSASAAPQSAAALAGPCQLAQSLSSAPSSRPASFVTATGDWSASAAGSGGGLQSPLMSGSLALPNRDLSSSGRPSSAAGAASMGGMPSLAPAPLLGLPSEGAAFETLAHALELPALAAAFASSDHLLLTALKARLGGGAASLSASEVMHSDSLFERLPLAALWRAISGSLARLPTALPQAASQAASQAAPSPEGPAPVVPTRRALDVITLVDRSMRLLLEQSHEDALDYGTQQLVGLGQMACGVGLHALPHAAGGGISGGSSGSGCGSGGGSGGGSVGGSGGGSGGGSRGSSGGGEVGAGDDGGGDWLLLRGSLHLFSNVITLIIDKHASQRALARTAALHAEAASHAAAAAAGFASSSPSISSSVTDRASRPTSPMPPAARASELLAWLAPLEAAFVPLLSRLIHWCCAQPAPLPPEPVAALLLASSVLASLLTATPPADPLPLPPPAEPPMHEAGWAYGGGAADSASAASAAAATPHLSDGYLRALTGGGSATALARAPFPFEMAISMEAPFASVSAPPVLWDASDDLGFFSLTGLADELLVDAIAADRRQPNAEAPPTGDPAGGAAGGPAGGAAGGGAGGESEGHALRAGSPALAGSDGLCAWAEALLTGCTQSTHFEVASCCALTL